MQFEEIESAMEGEKMKKLKRSMESKRKKQISLEQKVNK